MCPPEVLWRRKLLDEALYLRVPQHRLPEGPVERSTAWKRHVPNPKNCLLFRLYRATPPSEPLLWFMMEITRKLQNNQAELNGNMHQNDDSSRPWPHTLYGRPIHASFWSPQYNMVFDLFVLFLKKRLVTNIINPCRYSCCYGLNAEVLWVFYFLMFSYLTWRLL